MVFGAAFQGAAGFAPATAWNAAAVATAVLLASSRALKAARRMRSLGESWVPAAGGMGVAWAWWLATGYGYGRALCRRR